MPKEYKNNTYKNSQLRETIEEYRRDCEKCGESYLPAAIPYAVKYQKYCNNCSSHRTKHDRKYGGASSHKIEENIAKLLKGEL